MQEYSVVDIRIETRKKIRVLGEIKQAKSAIKYRDDVFEGRRPRHTREVVKQKIADWAKKKGIKYATCPKCKHLMNLAMAQAQKNNKRPNGVECLACINGYKRK